MYLNVILRSLEVDMSDFSELKIKLHLSIGYAGANQEDEHNLSDYFDEDTWNSMSDLEKETEISNIANEWSNNYIECSGWVDS